MDIQRKRIADLNPASYNPRKNLKPGDPEYDRLKKAIQEFDLVEPLVWNRQTGNLVGGHQRLKILAEMGVQEVDVSVVDLDPVAEKALNLALNKTGGDWDEEKLRTVLAEMEDSLEDIEITGFSQEEIDELFAEVGEIQHDMAAQKSGATPWDRMNGAGSEGVVFHFGALTCKIPESVYDDFYAAIDENRLAESIAEVLSRAIRDS